MTYASIMVILAPGQDNSAILALAADGASRFEADVIGIGACEMMPVNYGGEYVSGGLVQLDQEDINKDLAGTEKAFRDALKGHANGLDWRSVVTFGNFADCIAREARSADLLITSVPAASVRTSSRNVDLHGLIMGAGRPVLLAPPDSRSCKLDSVLLAWKDTRETRRAAVDALPLFQNAGQVFVVSVGVQDELEALRASVQDVVAWLKRHGVAAEGIVSPSTGGDAVSLETLADQRKADLIVAGAYGHSRLGEWMLGGVTRDLLLQPSKRLSLVSH